MNRAIRAIILEASEDELREAFVDTPEDFDALAARGRASVQPALSRTVSAAAGADPNRYGSSPEPSYSSSTHSSHKENLKNAPEIRTSEELRLDIRQRAQDDADFRKRLLADPGATIEADYGLALPEGFSLEVHEETAMAYHLVLLPSEELSQAELESIAAGHPGHTGIGPCG